MGTDDVKPDVERLLDEANAGQAPEAEDAPRFVQQARQDAARDGVPAIELLEREAFNALRDADYPTSDCIRPYELELARGQELPADRLQHVDACRPCRRLLRVAQRRPFAPPPLPPTEAAREMSPLLPALATAPARGGVGRWTPAFALAATVAIAAALFAAIQPWHSPRPDPSSVASTPSGTSGIQASIPPEPAPTFQSVAVVSSAVPETRLADANKGLSEALARRLSRIDDLAVIGPETETAKRLSSPDSLELARDIGVHTLISARMTTAGTRLNVDADMRDTVTGRTLFSRHYATTQRDLASFNARLAADLSERLRPNLTTAQREPIVRIETQDPESYLLYLQGRSAWARRDKQGLQQALQFFDGAVTRDPRFALAYVGLADTYALQGIYSLLPPAEAQAKAETAARRALEIDSGSAEAYTSLALVNLSRRRYGVAEEDFKRAIDLKPSYPLAHRWFANLLMAFERFPDARPHIERTLTLDPLSQATRIWKSVALCYQRKPEEAIRDLRAVLSGDATRLAADASEWQIRVTLGQALDQAGQYAAAIEELNQARRLSADHEQVLATLAHAHAKANNRADALTILQQITSRQGYSPIGPAWVYAALGEKDKAFSELERAFASDDSDLLFLRVDPFLDELREDARFGILVTRMGLAPKPTTTATQ